MFGRALVPVVSCPEEEPDGGAATLTGESRLLQAFALPQVLLLLVVPTPNRRRQRLASFQDPHALAVGVDQCPGRGHVVQSVT
jgi:hypothetical protein